MKIVTDIGIENKNIIGEFNSKKAGISQESLPFLFEILSKNFYSNPIGSIVREITSNCFDSHKEAKVDDAVIIRKGEDDEGEFISFCDFGVGLSPERINNIYMNYFSSTKRDSDEQIGGFGLGSKSPLAYTDIFYINTNFDGIKYNYVFSKGSEVPILDLLRQEPTEEHNGTEIKIHIKSDNDIYKFRTELKEQLCYFDNVVFEGWDINNNYKIYEGETFKYRNSFQYSGETHLILGKVAYTINYKEIGLESSFKIPIGVKFEIGEFQVTPNREAIRYTEETCELIRTRLLACIEEIKELYEKEAKVLDDFWEWYEHRNERPHINLSDEDKLYLTGLGEAKVIFKPFKDLGLYDEGKVVDDHLLQKLFSNVYTGIGLIRDAKYIERYTSNIFYNIKQKSRNYAFCVTSRVDYKKLVWFCNNNREVYKKSANLNYYYSLFTKEVEEPLTWTVNFQTTFNRDEQTYVLSNIVNNGAKALDIHRNVEGTLTSMTFGLDNYIIYSDSFQTYIDSRIANQRAISVRTSELGSSIKAFKLYKLIKDICASSVIDLDNFIPSKEEEEKFEEWRLQNNGSLRRKREGKIACQDILKRITRSERKLSDLDDYNGIIVYGYREDDRKLNITRDLLGHNKYFITEKHSRRYINSKALQILQISKSNAHYFTNNKNMTHISNLYSDNRVFRRLATIFRAVELLHKLGGKGIETMKVINEDIYNLVKEIEVYLDTNGEDVGYSDIGDYKEGVLEVAYNKNLFDLSIAHKFDIVDKYFEGADMLKIVEINEENLPIILKYLKEKKKKINLKYYQKYVPSPELGTQVEMNFEIEEENKTKFVILTEKAA